MCVSSNSSKICTQANKSAYTPNYFFKLLNKKAQTNPWNDEFRNYFPKMVANLNQSNMEEFCN